MQGIYLIQDKPKDVPKGWYVMMAQRSLAGAITWVGENQHGGIAHFAALPPVPRMESIGWWKHNVNMDARLVWYTTLDTLITVAKGHLKALYGVSNEELKSYTVNNLIEFINNKELYLFDELTRYEV